jgi:alpha-glucosidase
MAFYAEVGVDGFWTDMNEPASWGQFTPNLIEFDFEGASASHREARNVYGMQMARSAQEGSLLQNKSERSFVLTRAGFAGIQRYAAAWTGDNTASEEHMMAGIRLVNSLGLSGVAFAGYDVGGFAGESSKSLFARWMSIAAFSPLFRAHSMINTTDSEPWAFGEEVEEISRNYMKLRYRLLPTIYSAFYQSTKTGLPLASSLAISYPADAQIYLSAFQNQYLFCDRFLIAPVESYKEISKAYLPKGEWYYLYSDKVYGGSEVIYIDTPLNYLPVFIKGGSVFTMQSDVSFTAESNDGLLRVHIYKGSTGSTFVHYEDDGISHDHQSGDFLKREFSYDSESNQVKIGPSIGNYKSDYSSVRIFFHGFDLEEVIVDQKSISLEMEDYEFLAKLTEFDPLPENDHPYLDIKKLPFLDLAFNLKETIIQLT